MEWQQGSGQQMMDRAVYVLQNFVLAHALIFTDAPRYIYQLIVDGITPFISSYAVRSPRACRILYRASMELPHRGMCLMNGHDRMPATVDPSSCSDWAVLAGGQHERQIIH